MDGFSQWPGQQNAQQSFDEANIDPRLLNNVGSWPNSEESHNSTSVPTVEQAVQDVDRSVNVDVEMTYAEPTDLAQTQTPFPTPATHDGGQWHTVQTPRHKYPTRQQQHMLPTPDTSSLSHQRGQTSSAYHQNTPAWQSNNPYSLLGVDTAHIHQQQDFAGGNAIDEHGNLTPISQQQAQAGFFDNAYVAPSPLTGRGPTHDPFAQPTQDHMALAADFHGWQHPNVPPTEDMYTWAQGAYNVGTSDNFPTPPPQQTPSNNKKGKKKASARSGLSTGTFLCETCGKAHDSKSERDHHARNHDPSKRTKLCSICSKPFLFDKDVKRHMKTHEKERHIFCNYIDCPFRHKGFKRRDHLVRHVRQKHKQEEE
ncbi:hypothetical protein M409DRAFT_57084 [Zasmidium cellare ATCC 36951]|uniref:C2H2-type domain-containing protein n=1 Tax=Zasmidium cellare ATCC 36951 TaxID=1080233 RepID=A0A6A6CDH8_ZASCE|nr:uncharacterized protein M409DRAFT_57084 [Zasmidium cellare ATCC 36951]KAF2163982.1 hypothetical protein M409DRAFT_57084 [Zasmidium cellare ATCC 36951]